MFGKVRELFNSVTSNFNHFYFVPLFGLLCWYILLFGLMGSWIHNGSKAYPKYDENETPLPLERVGMILQPGFFLTFVVIHSVVFCTSMYLEYYHRKIGKLIKFIKPTVQKRLAYASLFFGVIAQMFFIAQAISGTVYVRKHARETSHYAVLLATFAILVMISLGLNFTNYYIMGQYYRKYVNGERWNKFTISFMLKIIWLVVTIAVAVVCCAFYVQKVKDVSSVLEWIFHFWYGLLLAFWTYDLYPLTELRALRKNQQIEKKSSIKDRLAIWRSKTFTGHRSNESNNENGDVVKDEKNEHAITSMVATDSSINGEQSSAYSIGELDSPVGFNYISHYDNI